MSGAAGRDLEIEGALLVMDEDPASVADEIAALREAGGRELVPRPDQDIRDVYFDSAERQLSAKRIALRLREVDGTTFLTLKFGRSRSLGVTSRTEIETPWSPASLSHVLDVLTTEGVRFHRMTAGWDGKPSTPRAALRAMGFFVRQARHTHRRRRDVIEDGAARQASPRVGELAIDAVTYELERSIVRLFEIEVEVKDAGKTDDIADVLDALIERFDGRLRRWRYGKLVTGLAIGDLLRERGSDRVLSDSCILQPQALPLLETRLLKR